MGRSKMGADFVFGFIRKPGPETLGKIDLLDEDTLARVADRWFGDEKDPEETRARLREAVKTVLTAAEQGWRDYGEVNVTEPGVYVLSGGMTWGDDPTELCQYLWALEEAGVV
jgi:hypothetical protein